MSVPQAAALGSGPGAKGAEPPEPPEAMGLPGLPEAMGLLELCGACRQRLSPQREPRLLPCLHSVCRACLGTAPGAAGTAGHAFECPVCQQQCPLGDIMENFFLQASGASPAASGQSCTSCEDNAAATSFCLECSEPLCDTCVEAHLRVRYTRQHSVQPLGSPGAGSASLPVPVPVPCPRHPSEPLSLFCSACDALTCRHCHLGPHRQHPSQPLDSAVRQQRSVLAALLQRLADRHAELQRSARDLAAFSRRVSDAQQRLQVEVKLAILHIMRELNKRAKALLGDLQRVTEARQERLERQRRALGRARRLQEHALRFGARALQGPQGTALLLSHRLVHAQLLRALALPLEPPEPQAELSFQWDRQSWTSSAQSFGTIISEPPLPPLRSPPRGPSPTSQGHPQATVVTGGQVTPELLLQGPPQLSPPPPLSPPPRLSPPPLEPAAPETPEMAPSPENGVTGRRTRTPSSSPREEKFVKKLLIKRRGPPGAQGSPRLPKQPRVSLERLELDLELDPAQPPLFRIFPGPSAQEFSLIVIEQASPGTEGTPGTPGTQGTPGTPGTAGTQGTEGTEGTEGAEGAAGTVQPPGALLVKEEQQESPIGDTGDSGDTKPVGLLPPAPGEPGPAPGPSPARGLPGGVPGVPGVPGVSCCRVCGQAGAVVMCDRCQRCFHLHCHLPALQDVPSPEWTCLLCQELPPPLPQPEQPPPLKLSPQDQQRCEFVLLELLCHEPCRPLQRLCSSPEGGEAMDLTLMRARLQEKLSPPYGSPEEFARDGWRLLRQFHRLTEDKADVQSILGLQRFLESRLSAAFGDQKFSKLLLDPEEPLQVSPGS